MGSLSSLSDAGSFLVADASVVINLNASGYAEEMLEALARRVTVVDVVPGELEEGRHRQRQDALLLEKLVASSYVEIVSLDEAGERCFEQLVIGPAHMTLDDGEAATIAYAVAHGGAAAIDEVKANRICAELFPTLQMACSVDVFAHESVQKALGRDCLADAVFNALSQGRMRVLPRHLDWVVGLIGANRAGLCASLPRHARVPRRLSLGRSTGNS